jgi:hypothetical protein
MKLKGIHIGFVRNPDGTLHWTKYEKTQGYCGCVIFWFACFAIELLYDQDCADYKKGDHDEI